MLRNYLTSLLRYISRNRTFTLLNVLGLVIGMTAFMLIGQYAHHELTYDTFWPHADRVYRLQLDRYDKGELATQWAAGCLGVGPDVKAAFPEVDSYVRMTSSNALLSYGDAYFKEEGVYYASKEFFRVFGYPLVAGTDSTALDGPNKIVLSRSLAKKYFGDENPVGKTMRNNGETEYLVTGVFEDLPVNTHMELKALLSFATYARLMGRNDESELTYWQWDGFLTYIKLNENTAVHELERKMPALIEEKAGEDMKRFNAGMEVHFMPIRNIHLDSDFIGEFKANGDRDTTYFLMVIALLIILIAWINYINLSTAKSIDRAREVGVRKVMGGFRAQLVQQFLAESAVMNVLSVSLSVGAVVLLIPAFNSLTGRALGYDLFFQPLFWGFILVLLCAGTLLSGLYPAFVLAAFRPVEVLKGRFRNSDKGTILRKSLVVVQFVASITLIAGTFTVYRQITYMRNQKLGVDIDQTMVMRSPNVVADSIYGRQFQALKNQLLQYPEVSAVSASTSIPGGSPDWNAGGIRRLSQREEEQKQYRVIMMDHDFIPAYGLEVVEGRPFSGEVSNEEATVLLNESASRHMGFANPSDAINDQIFFWGDTFRIVGVLKDYRQESAKNDFEPLIFRYNATPGGFYSIKFNTSNVQQSLAKFEALWLQVFPGNPFDFFFLDDHYNRQYGRDQQFGKVFALFAGLAIFIACLGLFGLSSLTAAQRTKEIGVRKVLGASVGRILLLVSRDYLVLMMVSIVIAGPLIYWIMSGWLEAFANRIGLTWIMFAVPSIVVVLLGMATVSFHTVRAARTNPAQSLRYE
jgi:putative ABC transport system permease protein